MRILFKLTSFKCKAPWGPGLYPGGGEGLLFIVDGFLATSLGQEGIRVPTERQMSLTRATLCPKL